MKSKSKGKHPKISAPAADSKNYGVFVDKSKKFNLYSIIAGALFVVMCLVVLFAPIYSINIKVGRNLDNTGVKYEQEYRFSTFGATKHMIGSLVDLEGNSELDDAAYINTCMWLLESNLQNKLRSLYIFPSHEEQKQFWSEASASYETLYTTFYAEYEARNEAGLREFLLKGAEVKFAPDKLEALAEEYLDGEYTIDKDFCLKAQVASGIAEQLSGRYGVEPFSMCISHVLIFIVVMIALIVALVKFIPMTVCFVKGNCEKIRKIYVRDGWLVIALLITMLASGPFFAFLATDFGRAEYVTKYSMGCGFGVGPKTIGMIVFCAICTVGMVVVKIMASKQFDALQKEMAEPEASADADAEKSE